jgi:hypothetical protein
LTLRIDTPQPNNRRRWTFGTVRPKVDLIM